MGYFTNFLAFVAGCSLAGHPKEPLGPLSSAETAAVAPDSATPTTDSAETRDTAPTSPSPLLEPMVHLYPDHRGDGAGDELDVADLDGDGRDDLLIGVTAELLYPYSSGAGRAKLHFLQAPFQTGNLRDQATATWQIGELTVGFGANPLILPSTQQVAAAAGVYEPIDSRFALYDLPAPAGSSTPTSADFSAYFDHAGMAWLGVPRDSARCATASGPAICLSGNSVTEEYDFSGHLLVYELPFSGRKRLMDYTSWLKGDPYDSASLVTGDTDLDGDGRDDLVVAAFQWGDSQGRLAVVTELPPGEHRLWDVAQATLTGEAELAQVGQALATSDLNQDGYGDVLAGAPSGERPGAFVWFGPFEGDRTTAAADIAVHTNVPGERLGFALTGADFTGDDMGDLAIGAPSNGLSENFPGFVVVFDDPRGQLSADEATWHLTSGAMEVQHFGRALRSGDLDGDGRADLVVGAPLDSTVGRDAGSVTIFSGAFF